MVGPHVPGTEGYAEQASSLIAAWRLLRFDDKPDDIRALIPTSHATVLDIGAGIGTDAAALAAMGHQVLAVEPVRELREFGSARYAALPIEWMADSLPALRSVSALRRRFDVISLWAVWMHLDPPERQAAMAALAGMLNPDGCLIMSLRHGPAPAGRRVFAVTAAETIALAGTHGLRTIVELQRDSVQPGNRAAGVTWTHLGFVSRTARDRASPAA